MNIAKSISIVLAAWVVLGGNPALSADKPLMLKLATIAPKDSSYHQNLEEMKQRWKKASNGAVDMTIYVGGTQGSEADTVQLMMTKNLQASLLTVIGLSEIEPATSALQNMPMAFRNLAEVDHVGEKLRPSLERGLAAKGFKVLFWTDSGWVRFFTKAPVLHPEDLRKLKVFSWGGSAYQADLWKSAGFTPVQLESDSVTRALSANTISAVPTPPIFANFGRFMDIGGIRYMLDLNWAPLVGALVVRQEAWDKVPEAARSEMLSAAAEIGKKMTAVGRAENEKAVETMQKRGLVVTKVTPAVEQEWREAVEKVNDKIRGKIVPAAVFDEAQQILKQYRSAGGK